jgi:hypothetical protein
MGKTKTLLDPASAKKILDADVKNIVAKVSAGKTLTSRERATIEQATNEKEIATSVKELIAVLGIPRSSYYKHKKDPDCPADFSLDAWREFLSKKKLGLSGKPLSPEEVAQLKGRLLAERTAREKIERKLKELKLEREQGGFVPMEQATEAITRVLEPINRILESMAKRYAARVNPGDADFGEEALREIVFEIKDQIVQARGDKISKRKGVK